MSQVLTLRPGEKFEVPVGAHFEVKFGSPFSELELSAAELSVIYTHNGTTSSWDATADGTGILLEILPGMLETGFYALKPRAVVAGKARKFRKAVSMRVLGDGETV